MKKIKVLIWGDAPNPIAFTGYGTVVANIWKPLFQTGKFDIKQIAINYHGSFFNTEDCPWQLVPAKLADPNDPYGTHMFLQAVAKEDLDLIWIINDAFIPAKATLSLQKIFESKRQANQKVPKIVFYYPIDSHLKMENTSMIKMADKAVVYAKYGFDKTIEICPELRDKLHIIHHGTNTSVYFPYSKPIIQKLKQDFFNLPEDAFLIVNVNRNTMRKQLWRNLIALKEFRKIVPNAYLYLHSTPVDRIDLLVVMQQLGLELNKDIFFPPNYSPSHGYPEELLNQLINCGDIALTTAIGEGWGLFTTQAMACGVPFVGPTDSVNPEILGINNERGYLYPVKDQTYIDLSGLRPVGLMTDIVDTMVQVYKDGWKHTNKKVIQARKWVEANDWQIINQQWMMLIENLFIQKQEEDDLGEMIL